jgi:hypothetical protein
MKKTSISFALVAAAALAAGCSFHARSPEDYAKDTQKILETKSSDIKKCYDDALKTNTKLTGKVTVKFTVKAETGELTSVAVDPANTTAAEPLPSCVTTALSGLKLAEPDARDGLATYAWDFQASAAPTPTAQK